MKGYINWAFLLWLLFIPQAIWAQENDSKCSYNYADSIFLTGNYLEAFACSQKLVTKYESLGYRDSLIMSLNLHALAALNSSQDGSKSLVRALNLNPRSNSQDSLLVAETLYIASKNEGNQGRFKKSIEYNLKSIEIRKVLLRDNQSALGGNYNMLGYCFRYLGEYEKATDNYGAAVEIWNNYEGETLTEMGKSYDGLGWVAIAIGRPLEALDYLESSLKLKNELHNGDHPSISNTLHWMSNAYYELSDFSRSLELEEETLRMRLATLGKKHVNVGVSYGVLSDCYLSLGDFEKSISYRKQQIAIYKSFLSNAYLLSPFNRLALAYDLNGQSQEYIKALKEADSSARDAGDFGDQYMINNYILQSNFQNKAGNQQLRLEVLEKAKNLIDTKVKSPGLEAKLKVVLGNYHLENDNLLKAKEYFDQTLAYYQSTFGLENTRGNNLYLGYGKLYFKTGVLDSALTSFKYSVNCLYTKGGLYEITDSIEPSSFLELNGVIKGLSWCGKVLQKQFAESADTESLKAALKVYKNGIICLNYLRNSMLTEEAKIRVLEISDEILENAMEVTFQLYALTGKKAFIQDALNISEQSKSMILKGAINDQKAKLFTGVPDSIVSLERAIRGEIVYLRKKLVETTSKSANHTKYQKRVFDLENKFSNLSSLMEQEYPEYFDLKYQSEKCKINEMQKLLIEEDAILISYYITENHIYVIAISADNTEFRCLDRDNQLNSAMDGFVKSTSDFDFIMNESIEADSLYIRSSQFLYNYLVKESVGQNEDILKLIIVPHGELILINFGSLLTSKPSDRKYRNHPYLLKMYDIFYSYAVSLYQSSKLETAKSSQDNYAGFAPWYKNDVSEFSLNEVRENVEINLPFALEEVRDVSKSQGGKVWLNAAATELAFKTYAPKYRTIHLAMHGFIDQVDPSNSRLLFAVEVDSVEDGILHIDEIYNLPLDADLVVLSACESGSGRFQFGEGNISLSRAFNYAGCNSVVMSQWKVPDRASRDIVTSFFEQLNDGATKSQALRKAKLNYLNNSKEDLYAHPFFWAGFVVSGNDEPIYDNNNRLLVNLIAGFLMLVMMGFYLRRQLL